MRNLTLTLILSACLTTAACGPRDKDKLDDSELAGTPGGADKQADTRCTSRAVTDEVKRQLFARAAQSRGSNGDNYAKIAGFALIELNGSAPLAEVTKDEQVDCRGNATLRLPAGLKVAGGRTALGGDIGYTVAPGSGMVTLGQSDSISIPLATLTQDRAVARAAPVAPRAEPAASAPIGEPGPLPAPAQREVIERPVAVPQAAPRPTVATSAPSFNCRRARTSGERAVCSDGSLAALDRDMAAQYRRALANGGARERALLVETRDRFLGFRDRCPSNACIDRADRWRMREIDDIVAGRWRGRGL
jgi:uncharacterized protein